MARVFSRAWLPVLLSAAITCSDAPTRGTPPTPGPERLPNIILILSDDEDLAIHAFLPKTKALLQDHGTTFSNFFVTYSLCCPSRASILRGQYAHNTGIQGNVPPAGGYLKFAGQGLEHSTIATWLEQAGYRTILAGKYLNGYGINQAGAAPPGWTQWYGGIGDAPYRGFNYAVDENGRFVNYGAGPGDFLTDVIARKAAAAIHQAAQDSTPLFLYLAPFLPSRTGGLRPAALEPLHWDAASHSSQLQRGGRERQAITHPLPPVAGPQ